MRSIVVGTDGSPSAEAAVRHTIELAKATGDSVRVVAAYPHPRGAGEPLAGTARHDPVNLRQTADNVIARAAREFEAAGIEVETDAREGDAASVLIDVAAEADADLIVVGARGESALTRFLLGSVSSKLVHHAPCSVLVVRER